MELCEIKGMHFYDREAAEVEKITNIPYLL